ncbi:hypothetical protein Ccrd_007001 [Cynara cardunculus var. scolymus]|uniref:Uncharacterized protein n=1 Tax=Cynara cardunculus var. scolymus TaxID=59895 RepID=A0A103XHV9_CYNCS|nr:hypothetical protein Ccrd_007001 [Cynara cardunculus var. scolymus]
MARATFVVDFAVNMLLLDNSVYLEDFDTRRTRGDQTSPRGHGTSSPAHIRVCNKNPWLQSAIFIINSLWKQVA